MQVRATENTEEFGKCGCGRSPTGKCIGWHGLTEEQYQAELAAYESKELAVVEEPAMLIDDIPGLTKHLVAPADKMSYELFCEKFPIDPEDKISVEQVITLDEEHGIKNYYEKLEIFRRQEYEKYLNGDPYYNAQ